MSDTPQRYNSIASIGSISPNKIGFNDDVNPVEKIKEVLEPVNTELWKNIPVPVMDTTKILVNALNTLAKMMLINGQQDRQFKNIEANHHRIALDAIGKLEQENNNKLKQHELVTEQMFQHIQLETERKFHDERKDLIQKVNEAIDSKWSNETINIRNWCSGIIDEKQHQFSRSQRSAIDRAVKQLKEQLTCPGVIGHAKGDPYQSIQEFFKATYEQQIINRNTIKSEVERLEGIIDREVNSLMGTIAGDNTRETLTLQINHLEKRMNQALEKLQDQGDLQQKKDMAKFADLEAMIRENSFEKDTYSFLKNLPSQLRDVNQNLELQRKNSIQIKEDLSAEIETISKQKSMSSPSHNRKQFEMLKEVDKLKDQFKEIKSLVEPLKDHQKVHDQLDKKILEIEEKLKNAPARKVAQSRRDSNKQRNTASSKKSNSDLDENSKLSARNSNKSRLQSANHRPSSPNRWMGHDQMVVQTAFMQPQSASNFSNEQKEYLEYLEKFEQGSRERILAAKQAQAFQQQQLMQNESIQNQDSESQMQFNQQNKLNFAPTSLQPMESSHLFIEDPDVKKDVENTKTIAQIELDRQSSQNTLRPITNSQLEVHGQNYQHPIKSRAEQFLPPNSSIVSITTQSKGIQGGKLSRHSLIESEIDQIQSLSSLRKQQKNIRKYFRPKTSHMNHRQAPQFIQQHNNQMMMMKRSSEQYPGISHKLNNSTSNPMYLRTSQTGGGQIQQLSQGYNTTSNVPVVLSMSKQGSNIPISVAYDDLQL